MSEKPCHLSVLFGTAVEKDEAQAAIAAIRQLRGVSRTEIVLNNERYESVLVWLPRDTENEEAIPVIAAIFRIKGVRTVFGKTDRYMGLVNEERGRQAKLPGFGMVFNVAPSE